MSEPEYLTVEEAAALLRIGRTSAYALAREWRDTGGREGLPVVKLGRQLRVPRAALKELHEHADVTPVDEGGDRGGSASPDRRGSPRGRRRSEW